MNPIQQAIDPVLQIQLKMLLVQALIDTGLFDIEPWKPSSASLLMTPGFLNSYFQTYVLPMRKRIKERKELGTHRTAATEQP